MRVECDYREKITSDLSFYSTTNYYTEIFSFKTCRTRKTRFAKKEKTLNNTLILSNEAFKLHISAYTFPK